MKRSLLSQRLLQILEKKFYHPETSKTWQQIFSDYDEELESPRPDANTGISSEITDDDLEIVTLNLMAYIMESYNNQTTLGDKEVIEIMGKMKSRKDVSQTESLSVAEGVKKINKLQIVHQIMRNELRVILLTIDQFSKTYNQMVAN